ncbi:hypothetical protein DAETH_06940 [Deinococcus aetherius]|uniref:Uncharacterized protein n=1 Tax=Deinococcus aetherius TaxID=200252 RepID=A0ABM8AAH8_9DEIO|nr:hypothetical protein DAETH_06940 [Deinococcus aetherius]
MAAEHADALARGLAPGVLPQGVRERRGEDQGHPGIIGPGRGAVTVFCPTPHPRRENARWARQRK